MLHSLYNYGACVPLPGAASCLKLLVGLAQGFSGGGVLRGCSIDKDTSAKKLPKVPTRTNGHRTRRTVSLPVALPVLAAFADRPATATPLIKSKARAAAIGPSKTCVGATKSVRRGSISALHVACRPVRTVAARPAQYIAGLMRSRRGLAHEAMPRAGLGGIGGDDLVKPRRGALPKYTACRETQCDMSQLGTTHCNNDGALSQYAASRQLKRRRRAARTVGRPRARRARMHAADLRKRRSNSSPSRT